MICFEASINGRKVCVAGVGATGVLTAILSWVNRERFDGDEKYDAKTNRVEELFFSVGGLTDHGNDNVHLKWLQDEELKPGDEVRIRIVERECCDPPIDARTDTADYIEKSKRAYYERLKQEYESGNEGN